MHFSELGLVEPIVRAVADEGYATPTPIQVKAIPPILAGKDVLGCAQTGTGKTGAFAMPILHRLGRPTVRNGRPVTGGARGRAPGALVLCPTRELASQIAERFEAYGRHLPLRHSVIFGGVNQVPQVRKLRAGIDVLVATPGRLLDLIEQGHVDLRSIQVLVLDEADRMLDMGFIRDIGRIMQHVPQQRQTLLFSATMPVEIRDLAAAILRDPVAIHAAPGATTAEAIAQSVYMVARQHKAVLLERLLRDSDMERTLVFTRTKHGADKLVKTLRRGGVAAGAIHGNKSQSARTRALAGFKAGTTPVLVATDIASRGIDVEQITHVINFDMPNTPETYVHRIGRTARAGAAGTAVSFCDHQELEELRAIERLVEMKLEVIQGDTDVRCDTLVTHRAPTPRQPTRRNDGSWSRRRRRRSRRAGTPAA